MSVVLTKIRKQALIRLSVAGMVLAMAAGAMSYAFAVDVLDALVHRLAIEQGTRLTHSMSMMAESTPMMAGRVGQGEADLGGFLFARLVSDGGEVVQERWKDDVPPSLRLKVGELAAEHAGGDRHQTFQADGKHFIFISIQEQGRRILGLYQIDDAVYATLDRQVIWSVAGVALAVLMALIILVPVMLGLERKVTHHARDAVDANLDALVTMGNAIAQRDSDTDAHNFRVTVYAVRLAEHMGSNNGTRSRRDHVPSSGRKAMFKKIALIAWPLAILATGISGEAHAESQCEASIKEVQAEWDKMYPMGMDRPTGNYRQVSDNFRIAKEKCKEGNVVETEQYLNVVRGHLHMPQHPAPHDRR